MTSPSIRISSPTTLHKPTGYSHVAEVTGGRIIYIAGQIAHNASGTLVGKDDFRAQAAQVFANLKAAIESAGGTFANIVKLNCYCCDRVPPTELAAFRELRDQFVDTQSPPVSTLVYVTRLARPEWLIEIEAVAAIP
jgi:enamine deaminase RidA (YjgF/YER057c/UK114 family)